MSVYDVQYLVYQIYSNTLPLHYERLFLGLEPMTS
jgi:hypothetical protein